MNRVYGGTESQGYLGSDSGCRAATEYLKQQSECLDCPFSKCIYDESRITGVAQVKKRGRDGEIVRLWNGGKKMIELVPVFGVSYRTIQRAIKKQRQRVMV